MTDASATNDQLSAALRQRRRGGATRWLLPLGLAALALTGGLWFYLGPQGESEGALSYSTQPAVRGDVVLKVTATGTLTPVVQVEVGSQVSGRIVELRADYNTEVKAGDVIALLDPERTKSALAQSKARLASSRAEVARSQALVENAERKLARARNLGREGAASKSDLDDAEANLRTAKAGLDVATAAVVVAKAALAEAQVNHGYTTIRSPVDGVVISRQVDVGQTVAASLQAPVLFVIAEDLKRMEVHTSVAESDVGRLTPGMTVEFSVDAYPERTFTGVVRQVRYEASQVSNVVTYDAVVTVANDDLALRPGMTANASFIIDARRDVVVVPQRALSYAPPEGARQDVDGPPPTERPRARPEGAPSNGGKRAPTVWVLKDGAPVPVRVEVGLVDGTLAEIVSGALEPGDRVITRDSSSSAAPAGPNGNAGGGDRPRRRPPTVL